MSLTVIKPTTQKLNFIFHESNKKKIRLLPILRKEYNMNNMLKIEEKN